MLFKFKKFTEFRDTFNDLNETFFIDKGDLLELYSFEKNSSIVYCFELREKDLTTDFNTFKQFVKSQSTELVETR